MRAAGWALLGVVVCAAAGCADYETPPLPPAPPAPPSAIVADAGVSEPPPAEPPAPLVKKDAPVIPDAKQLFKKEKPGKDKVLDGGLALCEFRFRDKPDRRSGTEKFVDDFFGVSTLGISTALKNQNEPDWFGIDLLMEMRFGEGPLYRAKGEYGKKSAFIAVPLERFHTGQRLTVKLYDYDAISEDDIVAYWQFKFEGGTRIGARYERSSFECRVLTAPAIEKLARDAVHTAETLTAKVRKAAPKTIARAARAKTGADLFDAAFDETATQGFAALSLARHGWGYERAWPEFDAADSALVEALRPVVYARKAKLEAFATASADGGLIGTASSKCDDHKRLQLVSVKCLPDTCGRRTPRLPTILYSVDAYGLFHRAESTVPFEHEQGWQPDKPELAFALYDAPDVLTCQVPHQTIIARDGKRVLTLRAGVSPAK